MSFEFVIPVRNSDLRTSNKNNYCVTRVYAPTEIPALLQDAKASYRQHGSKFIVDHFDTFFSVFDSDDCPSGTAVKSYNILFLALDKLKDELKVELEKQLSDDDRCELSNITKMLIYLFIRTIKFIDSNLNEGGGGKVGNKKQTSESDLYDWEKKRRDGLDLIYSITCVPLQNLYDPPVIEEDFSNLICDLSYRTLEQQFVRDKRVVETAFHIIATAIKRFNHAMVFPVQILQIIADKDFAIRPIADAIYNILYEEAGIKTIFDVLIKDLGERLVEDANDSKLCKNYGQFLTDLGNIAPKLMLPHLSDLAEDLLSHEPYTLRIALLQIMGDIFLLELSGEGLSEELRDTRDEFLDFLTQHIHDINAHVRSKVLQIWNHLKIESGIPLTRMHAVLERTVGRLEDKSSLVRKSAIILVKSFMEHNPFSSNLTLEQLEAKYDEEDAKLQELRKKQSAIIPELEKYEEAWESESTDMYTVIVENIDKPLDTEDGQLRDIAGLVGDYMKEKKYKEAFDLVRRGDACNKEDVENLTVEQKCQYYMILMKTYYDNINRPNDFQEEITKAEGVVRFFFDSINYTKLLNQAVPKLEELLMSKTNSDVFEAIEFFKTAYQFRINGCEGGVLKMLYLMWSDKEKKEIVTAAYKTILFTTDKTDRAHAVQVVENLSRFIENLTDGHHLAFEELVKEWVENSTIDPSIIQVMFEKYTKKLPNTSDNDSRLALHLLVLCSSASPNIVKRNIDFFIKYGIEEHGLEDYRIYCSTLELLTNSMEKKYEHPSKYYKRYEHVSDVVEKVLSKFMIMFFTNEEIDFDMICMKTFNFIYRLVCGPDVLSQKILLQIFTKLKEISSTLESRAEAQTQQQQEEPRANQGAKKSLITLTLPSKLLSRLVYLIGYIAMKEMIYLDIDVYSNMKYREELKNELKKKKNDKNVKKTPKGRRTTINPNLDMSATNALKRITMTPQDSIEEEDLVGATADDAIAEQINFILEDEMLYSNECILMKFHPLFLGICQYLNRYKDETLQQSVSLAMIHLMSVSSKFCEENVPFLMNIFSSCKNTKVKANIIIGLADFTFRFPNVIEPWTPHLYATLSEEDPELRLTAVKMLSHLILHEMIRVKGQISDLALCLQDSVPEIRSITEQFFKEIAQKSNILYNVLPDIISRLSDPSLHLEEGKYHVIMKYIMSLIQKDKQVESLVEKLCLRFKLTNTDRQWRDNAYCLSLLNYNEKTIKKLIEHIPCFKDKVQINEIYDSFKLIISNTSKLAKPELKAVVQEFEARLNECLEVNEDQLLGQEGGEGGSTNKTIVESQSSQSQKPTRKGRGGKEKAPPRIQRGGRAGGRGRRRGNSSSSEESENSDFENRNPVRKAPAARPEIATQSTRTPRTATKKTTTVTKVIEESDTSDLEEQPKPKRKLRGRRNES